MRVVSHLDRQQAHILHGAVRRRPVLLVIGQDGLHHLLRSVSLVNHGKLGWSNVDTGRDMPTLVELQRIDVEQQLEVVHRQFGFQVDMILQLIAVLVVIVVGNLVEGGLLSHALRIIFDRLLTVAKHVMTVLHFNTGHVVIARTHLHILRERNGQVESDTRRSDRQRHLKMLQQVTLVPVDHIRSLHGKRVRLICGDILCAGSPRQTSHEQAYNTLFHHVLCKHRLSLTYLTPSCCPGS